MENIKIDNNLIISGNDNAIEKVENVLREPSWSLRRKIITFSILLLIVLSFLIYKIYPILNPAPTCSDGVKNALEEGIDCNGECQLVCKQSFSPINVVGATVLSQSIISSIAEPLGIIYLDNPNRLSAPYEIAIDYKVLDANNVEILATTTLFNSGTQKQNIVLIRYLPIGAKTIEVTNLKYKMYKTQGSMSISLKDFELSEFGQSMRVYVSNVYDEDINSKLPIVLIVKDSKDNILAVANQELNGIKYRETKELFFTWTTTQVTAKDLRVEVFPVSYLYAQ